MQAVTRPRVSIAMPVYNGERYLRETLDSMLDQTFTDFELIISDNASTDGTQAICEAYAARDPRVRYSRNARNMGASWNFNHATALCRGEYIKHAAHDDLLAPTYLERCVEVLDRDPSVILCYPRSICIDENGDRLPFGPGKAYRISLDLRSPSVWRRFQQYHDNCHEGSGADPVFGVVRATAMRQTSIVGPYIGSDLILLAELALIGKFYEVPEELFYVRVHSRNSTYANPGRDARGSWFDPNNQGRLRNQIFHWEWLYRYLAAINRYPMSAWDRLGCYRQMPRWIWRHRTRLAVDLIAAAALIARRHLGAAGALDAFDRVVHPRRRSAT